MTGKMILKNGIEYDLDVTGIERDLFNKVIISGILNKITVGPRISHSKPYKKIIFNYPATIVIWNDGTKTVVKCQEGESYDKEKGVAMCFMKKFLGNKSNFNNVFRDCGALNEEDEDGTD